MSIDQVLLIISLVSFLLATANVPASINLIGLGLACWIATILF